MAFENPAVAAVLLRDLGIPEGYSPQFGVALGYADEQPETPHRRRDVIRILK